MDSFTQLPSYFPRCGLISTFVSSLLQSNPQLSPLLTVGIAVPFFQYELNARGFMVECGSDGFLQPPSTFSVLIAPSAAGKSTQWSRLCALRAKAVASVKNAYEPASHEGVIPFDGTSSGLTDALRERYNTLRDISPGLIWSDEVAKVLQAMQRPGSKSADLAEFLNTWLNGRTQGRVLRKGKDGGGVIEVRNPRISGGGITVLASLKHNTITEGMLSGGFLGRCMVLLDASGDDSMPIFAYSRGSFEDQDTCVQEYEQWLNTLDYWAAQYPQEELVFRPDDSGIQVLERVWSECQDMLDKGEGEGVKSALKRFIDRIHAVAAVYASQRGSMIMTAADLEPATALFWQSIESLRQLSEGAVVTGTESPQAAATHNSQESALRALTLMREEGLAPAGFMRPNYPKRLKGKGVGFVGSDTKAIEAVLAGLCEADEEAAADPLVTRIEPEVWQAYRKEVLKKGQGRPAARYFLSRFLPPALREFLAKHEAGEMVNVLSLAPGRQWQVHMEKWDELGWERVSKADWRRYKATAEASKDGTFVVDGELRKWPFQLEGSFARKSANPND